MLQSKRVWSFLFLIFAFLFAFLPQRWFRTARMWAMSFLLPAAQIANGAHEGIAGGDAPPASDSAALSDERVLQLTRENAELRQSLIRTHADNIEMSRKLQAVTQLVNRGFRKVPRIIEAGIVVSGDASNWHQALILDRGTQDGVREGQPVVWGRHLVGQVVGVGPYLSRVRTVVDPSFRMRAMVAGTPNPAGADKPESTPPPGAPAGRPIEERLLGVLEGDGDTACELGWILAEEKVVVGDIVVSIEEDRGRWPGGLVFGTIVEASAAHGPYYRLRVQPGVDIRSLASVFILQVE